MKIYNQRYKISEKSNWAKLAQTIIANIFEMPAWILTREWIDKHV